MFPFLGFYSRAQIDVRERVSFESPHELPGGMMGREEPD
jgi:hypothetical protein